MEAAEVAEDVSNDRTTLLLARDGSEEAGRLLVARHGPSMLRTAWHVLGRYGGNDAEDVVQEAFLAALTTDALPLGDVGAWLRSIVARKALDAMRGARRRLESPFPEVAGSRDQWAAVTGAPASVETMAVREALARLAPADRAVLVLVDLLGHSMAEAAEVLGTTNVGTRLRAVRARRKLAKLVRDGVTS
jgi:RNA polymerase sigma-70 factor (ECF subfamily)